jgi:hypothetical protein
MERDHLEDLGVDGRIIMELFSNRLGRDWIDLVQDMGKQRALVDALMNLRVT